MMYTNTSGNAQSPSNNTSTNQNDNTNKLSSSGVASPEDMAPRPQRAISGGTQSLVSESMPLLPMGGGGGDGSASGHTNTNNATSTKGHRMKRANKGPSPSVASSSSVVDNTNLFTQHTFVSRLPKKGLPSPSSSGAAASSSATTAAGAGGHKVFSPTYSSSYMTCKGLTIVADRITVKERIGVRKGDVRTYLLNGSAVLRPSMVHCIASPSEVVGSSILSALSGTRQCASGMVTADGVPVAANSFRYAVGFVASRLPPYPHLSNRRNVSLELSKRRRCQTTIEHEERVEDVLQFLGIDGDQKSRLNTTFEHLMLQIARELVSDPPVLFVRSPVAEIEYHQHVNVAKALRRIAVTLGKTVIVSTVVLPMSLYERVDTIMLVAEGGGGRVFGSGDVSSVVNYFGSLKLTAAAFMSPDDGSRVGDEEGGGVAAALIPLPSATENNFARREDYNLTPPPQRYAKKGGAGNAVPPQTQQQTLLFQTSVVGSDINSLLDPPPINRSISDSLPAEVVHNTGTPTMNVQRPQQQQQKRRELRTTVVSDDDEGAAADDHDDAAGIDEPPVVVITAAALAAQQKRLSKLQKHSASNQQIAALLNDCPDSDSAADPQESLASIRRPHVTQMAGGGGGGVGAAADVAILSDDGGRVQRTGSNNNEAAIMLYKQQQQQQQMKGVGVGGKRVGYTSHEIYKYDYDNKRNSNVSGGVGGASIIESSTVGGGGGGVDNNNNRTSYYRFSSILTPQKGDVVPRHARVVIKSSHYHPFRDEQRTSRFADVFADVPLTIDDGETMLDICRVWSEEVEESDHFAKLFSESALHRRIVTDVKKTIQQQQILLQRGGGGGRYPSVGVSTRAPWLMMQRRPSVIARAFYGIAGDTLDALNRWENFAAATIMFVVLLLSALFVEKQDDDQGGMQNKRGIVFFLFLVLMEFNTLFIPTYKEETECFVEQRNSGTANAIVQTITIVLKLAFARVFILSVVAGFIFYSGQGLGWTFVLFWGVTSFMHSLIIYALTAIFMKPRLVLIVSFCFTLYSALFSGFLINLTTVHQILGYVSAIRWGYGAVIHEYLVGKPYDCDASLNPSNNATSYCYTGDQYLELEGLANDSTKESLNVLIITSSIVIVALALRLQFMRRAFLQM